VAARSTDVAAFSGRFRSESAATTVAQARSCGPLPRSACRVAALGRQETLAVADGVGDGGAWMVARGWWRCWWCGFGRDHDTPATTIATTIGGRRSVASWTVLTAVVTAGPS